MAKKASKKTKIAKSKAVPPKVKMGGVQPRAG